MSQQIINIGAAPDDHTGDYARVAFDKCNDNFAELYKGAGSEGGLWNYNKTSTDTSSSPVSGRFRTNSGDYLNATQLAIHGTSIQGIDRSNMLRTLLKNDLIKLQDSLDGNAWCRYILRGPPVDHTTWFQIDIDLESSGSVASGDNQEINFVFTANSIGGMSGSAEYRFNSAVQTPPPASGYIRINNVSMAATTALYVNKITDTAADIGQLLLSISIGTVIVIQDNANSANFGRFQTSAVTIDGGSYVQIPVTSAASGGSIANNARVIFGILGSAAAGGGGNVSNSGTPTATQYAKWTDATHIQGVAAATVLSDIGAQPLDADLTAISALTGTNVIYYRSAADTWSSVTMGSGISFSGGVLQATAGGGNVTNVGTPTNGQIAQWTDATHIQGVAVASLGFAPIASPVFTGDPQAPTPVTADNDTSIATTAFVKAQGYATTVSLSGYLPLTGGVLTGPLSINSAGENLRLSGNAIPQVTFSPTSGATKVGQIYQFGDELVFGTSAGPSHGKINLNNSTWTFNSNINATGQINASGDITSNSGNLFAIGVNPQLTLYDSGTAIWGIQSASNSITMGPANAAGGINVNYFAIRSDGNIEAFVGGFKPGGGPWSDSSDARIKNVLGNYTNSLVQIKQLQPIRYTFKGNDSPTMPKAPATVPYEASGHGIAAVEGKEFVGLIAQDVEAIMPEMVALTSGYIDGNQVDDLRILDPNALAYALINAVKELASRVEALEARLGPP